MGSEVVQFRAEAELVAYLRERGINPNDFGREAFRASLRRFQAEEAIRRAKAMKIRLPKSPEEIIREEREGH